MPHFVECSLCHLPRKEGLPDCPFCRYSGSGRQLNSIPEDFAERLTAEGRWDTAAAFLEGEVAAGRETAAGCLLLAWIALISNDLRAVEVWSHESLRIGQVQAGPHLLLGLVFERGERWEEAVLEFSLALACPVPEERREILQAHRSYCQSQIPEW